MRGSHHPRGLPEFFLRFPTCFHLCGSFTQLRAFRGHRTAEAYFSPNGRDRAFSEHPPGDFSGTSVGVGLHKSFPTYQPNASKSHRDDGYSPVSSSWRRLSAWMIQVAVNLTHRHGAGTLPSRDRCTIHVKTGIVLASAQNMFVKSVVFQNGISSCMYNVFRRQYRAIFQRLHSRFRKHLSTGRPNRLRRGATQERSAHSVLMHSDSSPLYFPPRHADTPHYSRIMRISVQAPSGENIRASSLPFLSEWADRSGHGPAEVHGVHRLFHNHRDVLLRKLASGTRRS